MESNSIVQEIIQRNGCVLVCFLDHDGVFRLPAGDDILYAKVIESKNKKIEIRFTYDARLTILNID